MKSKSHLSFLSLCVLCSLWLSTASAHEGHEKKDAAAANPAEVEKAAKEMAVAANAFLDSLSKEQRETADFDFKDNERVNWHFIPKPRKGLTLKDMSEDQRKLAKALLQSGLSQKGNQKAITIMSLESILHDIEQGKGPERNPILYYWSIFGKPGGKDAWGWRVEGHHLSINFTVAEGKGIAGAPNFYGTNPAEVKDGPQKGLRILAEEEDLGRAFVKSLDKKQLEKAVINQTAPKDIVTGNMRFAVIKDFQGIPFTELTDAQRSALMEIVKLYAGRLRPELADNDLKRIAHAGLDKIYFAWAGGFEKGEGHYYRVHGPNVLL